MLEVEISLSEELIATVVLFMNRKWKETVDEWVKENQPGDIASVIGNFSSSGKILVENYNVKIKVKLLINVFGS